MAFARSILHRALAEKQPLDIVTDVDRIIQTYFGYYGDEIGSKYKILEVEKQYEVPLTEQSTYALRIDLLVHNLESGEIELWDHKFIYDFWSEDKLNLSPQFPKYTGALRFNGVAIDRCVLNQLRYRQLKNPTGDQLFKRTIQRPSDAKVKRSIYEQVTATQEILDWREMPIEERQKRAKRTLNPMVCERCSMKALCMSEYDGNDIKFLVQNDYRTKQKYGYNQEEAV
jgi:hypothetical protein